MSFTSYSNLKTEIADYLGRSDLTSKIPTFVTLAELRLSRDLRTRKMLTSASTTMTSGDGKVELPADFLEMRNIYTQGNPRMPVTYLSPSAFMRDARADEFGLPVFYTVLGAEFEFAPKPDTAYVLEMLYFAKPTPMSDSVSSNAFLANYPDVLLYASLLEAEPYLINDARTATWADLYNRAIQNIKDSDQNSEYSGVPLIMRVTSR